MLAGKVFGYIQSLVVALVLTKLDYGSATLAGLPAVQLDRLHSVLNAAVRLIYRRRKFDHVSPLLKELHWLRVPERITFRLAVLVKATAGVFCVVPICGLAAFPIR